MASPITQASAIRNRSTHRLWLDQKVGRSRIVRDPHFGNREHMFTLQLSPSDLKDEQKIHNHLSQKMGNVLSHLPGGTANVMFEARFTTVSFDDVDEEEDEGVFQNDEERSLNDKAEGEIEGCSPPYTNNHILCGRGGLSNNHKGNKRYREMLSPFVEPYLDAPKKDKKSIVMTALQELHKANLSFLKLDKKRNAWTEPSYKKIYDKVSQKLREFAEDLAKTRCQERRTDEVKEAPATGRKNVEKSKSRSARKNIKGRRSLKKFAKVNNYRTTHGSSPKIACPEDAAVAFAPAKESSVPNETQVKSSSARGMETTSEPLGIDIHEEPEGAGSVGEPVCSVPYSHFTAAADQTTIVAFAEDTGFGGVEHVSPTILQEPPIAGEMDVTVSPNETGIAFENLPRPPRKELTITGEDMPDHVSTEIFFSAGEPFLSAIPDTLAVGNGATGSVSPENTGAPAEQFWRAAPEALVDTGDMTGYVFAEDTDIAIEHFWPAILEALDVAGGYNDYNDAVFADALSILDWAGW